MAASATRFNGPTRVALAGFYHAGNFGDDLYAVLFGLALQRFGIPFSLYGLCDPYASRLGVERAPTLAGLLNGADALIWGGGGLLVSWPSLTYRLLYPSTVPRMNRLVAEVIRRRVPVWLASVGGDGRPPHDVKPAYRARLLGEAQSITVRSPQDAELLQAAGRAATYYPDVVWGLSREVTVPRRHGARMRIGIDLYPSNLVRQHAVHALPRLQAAVSRRTDCEFFCLDTTNATRKAYRGLAGIIRGAHVHRYQFRDLDADLAFIASLDVVLSSRFHTPIVALQYGVPAVSMLPERKTQIAYANLGLDRYCYRRERVGELVETMSDREAFDELVRGFGFPDVARLGRESAGHFDVLRDRLDGVTESVCRGAGGPRP